MMGLNLQNLVSALSALCKYILVSSEGSGSFYGIYKVLFVFQIFDICWDPFQQNRLVSCGVKHIKVTTHTQDLAPDLEGLIKK